MPRLALAAAAALLLACSCVWRTPPARLPEEGTGYGVVADVPTTPRPAATDLSAYRQSVELIVATALREGRSYGLLEELCTVAPKRLAGSEGSAAAEAWAVRTLLAAGLANVHLEAVEAPHWVRGEVEELTLLDGPQPGLQLQVAALGGSEPTPAGGVEAEVVEVASFEALAALGEAARGKLVFFNRPMDAAEVDSFRAYGGAVDQRSRGVVEAARAGALGAIVRSMTQRVDEHPHTGALSYAQDVARVPGCAISTRDAGRLSELLRDHPGARLRLRLDCANLPPAQVHNVVAELVGHERPEEILLVGGHLDAWDKGVGAHDDGAGCVQSIEAAALLARLGMVPRRTIRVVLFANEENGLRGARAYAEQHAGELGQHVFALESDRGGFVPRGFTTDAQGEAFALLKAATQLLSFAGASELRRGGGGADISVLADAGVVLAGLSPDPQRYCDVHHSELDTLEQVHARELELGTAAMAALLFVLADLPEPLPRNPARGAER